MRIIKFFFSSFLLIGIFALVFFLVFREFQLVRATSEIKGSIKALNQAFRSPNIYYKMCRDKGGNQDQAIPDIYQLRFTSDTNYNLEIICRQFPNDPIVIDERKLAQFVKKVPKSSGVIWGDEYSALALEIWGRKALISVESKEIETKSFSENYGIVPQSSCEGFGFACCLEQESIGSGEQIFNTLDCPKSCYQSCQNRPVVLAFNTDPFFDPKTRELNIKSGSQVTFSFLIDPTQSGLKLGRIDFGDGEEYDFFETQSGVEHTYNCLQSRCEYEAKINVTDNAGIESAQSNVTKIRVIINK